MKTLLFFDRCELTLLYSSISNELKGKINIIHVAYSEYEERILKEKCVIGTIISFKQEIKELLIAENVNINLLDEIDKLFIEQTNGRFNLNASLQSDRGFHILEYEKVLILAQVYYKFWNKIYSSYKIDYILHEPCSLYLNHVCAVLGRAYGAKYFWHQPTVDENGSISYLNIAYDDFSAIEVMRYYDQYISGEKQIDFDRCDRFLKKFRSNYEIYLGSMIKAKDSLLIWFISSLKEKLFVKKRLSQLDPLVDNIEYWQISQNPATTRFQNLKAYYHNLKFDNINKEDTYYYYSMHLEPEAVVLYLGDGIYSNQIKLIENIASSLPIGCYLYVKDHPHEFGYRSIEDYKRLKNVPNIKLISTKIPGKQLIKNAVGVFTINGTAGFEALLLGKQVYTFSKSFYTIASRVNTIVNIKELRQILYKNRTATYDNDIELYPFIQAYLDSLHVGVVDFFMGRASTYGVDLDSNAKNIADDFIIFSEIF